MNIWYVYLFMWMWNDWLTYHFAQYNITIILLFIDKNIMTIQKYCSIPSLHQVISCTTFPMHLCILLLHFWYLLVFHTSFKNYPQHHLGTLLQSGESPWMNAKYSHFKEAYGMPDRTIIWLLCHHLITEFLWG